MSEHLTQDHLLRYRERRLEPLELLEADEHLAECDVCRGALLAPDMLATVGAACRKSLESRPIEAFHPDGLQLAAYLDGTLDPVDREILDAHLQVFDGQDGCESCAAEVRELRAFRALMSAQPPSRHAPAPRDGFWRRLRGFSRGFLPGYPIQVAGAAGLAALAVFAIGVQPLRQEQVRLRQEYLAVAERAAEAGQARSELEAHLAEAERARDLQDQMAAVPPVEPPAPDHATAPAPRPAPPAPTPPAPPAAPGARMAAAPPLQEALPPGAEGLIGRQGVLLGSDSEGLPFRLISPVGTAVRNPQPVLRWEAHPGATQYRVALLCMDDDAVIESPVLTATEWEVTPRLKQGAAYTWQVTAVVEGREVASPVPPAPEARFRVLDADTARRLGAGSAPSHLNLGIEYARAGLLEDAERELRLALEADPTLELARKQLAAVERWRSPQR
jgi:hypothetical protein